MTKHVNKPLAPKQRLAIVGTLQDCIVTGADEQLKYNDGFSDASIAKMHGVAEHQVSKLRKDMFGKLSTSHTFPKFGEMFGRVTATEKRLESLTAILQAINVSLHRQEETIKALDDRMNKLDVRLTKQEMRLPLTVQDVRGTHHTLNTMAMTHGHGSNHQTTNGSGK